MTSNSQALLIFNASPSNRSGYIFRTIFEELLGLSITETPDATHFCTADISKISYGTKLTPDTLIFYADGFLTDGALPVTNWDNLIPMLNNDDKIDLKVETDVFSFAFFLLSRYEEYHNTNPDKHGRFTAQQSWAGQLQLLHLPLVNIIALKIKQILQENYPSLVFDCPQYAIQPSYDIDYAFSFKHKGWWRSLASSAKALLRGQFAELALRWRVITSQTTDPFYTFDYINAAHRRWNYSNIHTSTNTTKNCPIYFWLLGDWGEYDKNISHSQPALQALIKEHRSIYHTGIHPSYASNYNKSHLTKEIKRLEAITQDKVVSSRQHYLKLSLPQTYQNLIANGISADYSMGYAETTGFRAGIAHSFWWYDLSQERISTLRVHPFSVMDVTLQNYLALSPDEAIQRIASLISTIRNVGGTLCFIFHNNSLSEYQEWTGWRRVYERLLEG